MKFGLRQLLAHECTVCGQLFDPERRVEEGQVHAVFGSVNYGFCPCCRQEVVAPHNADPDYRRRYDEFLARRQERFVSRDGDLTIDFPDKVGRDKAGDICVRFRGEVQRPRFQDEGAAQAFLTGLQDGSRQPEPEERRG